jgi:predicted RNA-binding Zn-ribbon protein involved in translation (DUF1610 family)
MTWSPASGCIGKQTFLDKRQAKAMCRSVNTRNRLRGNPEAHIYRCPGCGYYHLGRPSGTRHMEDNAA